MNNTSLNIFNNLDNSDNSKNNDEIYIKHDLHPSISEQLTSKCCEEIINCLSIKPYINLVLREERALDYKQYKLFQKKQRKKEKNKTVNSLREYFYSNDNIRIVKNSNLEKGISLNINNVQILLWRKNGLKFYPITKNKNMTFIESIWFDNNENKYILHYVYFMNNDNKCYDIGGKCMSISIKKMIYLSKLFDLDIVKNRRINRIAMIHPINIDYTSFEDYINLVTVNSRYKFNSLKYTEPTINDIIQYSISNILGNTNQELSILYKKKDYEDLIRNWYYNNSEKGILLEYVLDIFNNIVGKKYNIIAVKKSDYDYSMRTKFKLTDIDQIQDLQTELTFFCEPSIKFIYK